MRASEGAQILTTLLLAQKDYQLETGNYTTVLNNLYVEYDAGDVAYFNWPPTLSTNITAIASITRTGGGYTLSIREDGIIVCGAADCSDAGY